MKKVLLRLGVGLLVIVALFYVTLVAPAYGPESCTFQLDLDKLRALAASMPGEKPREIRVEHVTSTDFPRAIACAGESWSKVQFRVYAYQLVFADKTIVIDTAMNASQAKEIRMTDGYDEAAWQRVSRGLSQASAAYVTHEHIDHMGGAVANESWAGVMHLTPHQLDGKTSNSPAISPAVRAAVKPLEYSGATVVAPGVVLIEAAGHTPGSQLVFITRADGTEVVLTGDTAWLMENIEREQGPAKFVPLMMGSDRHANSCQLAALNRIRRDAPQVAIMPGHDKAQMQALLDKGVFVVGFK